MKSTWPVDPRLRKLPRGTSITTSSSGTLGTAWRPPGRLSASWFTTKDYTFPDQATTLQTPVTVAGDCPHTSNPALCVSPKKSSGGLLPDKSINAAGGCQYVKLLA